MIQRKNNQSNDELLVEELLQIGRLGRRGFLLREGAALATAAALIGLPYVLRKDLTQETSFALFSASQRQVLQIVQEHLFPSGPDSPGAMDVNAAAYLEAVITAPGIDPDARNTIVNGVGRLQDASRERFDVLFNSLGYRQRDQLLRYLADQTRWGRTWLSLLLYYLFEALLSDLVYGGNPGEIGWRWLEHQPDFLRPPADKCQIIAVRSLS
ncbi:MAG: gluconate 2-dehydrogenase subunit 3 family protein [Proteobacteria bacterium]|nr:gluconate 2-dehydrogenase subunit 3 family protein [Pseudomonadota bacterium]